MSNETQIKALEQKVLALISEEPDHFLVDIRIKPTNNFKVYIDGNQGISVDKLVQYNRKLYKQLEEEGQYPDGDFSLELSSPGLDEPLKLHRQYLKNIGRDLNLLLADDRQLSGTLKAVTEEAIDIEYTEGKNKKAVVHQLTIPFADIKETIVLIKF